MASETKSILIFGATGLIGKHITRSILNNARKNGWNVSIFTSSDTASSKAEHLRSLKYNGARIITGDLTSESDIKAAYDSGIDTVVSCVGRAVIDKQILLVQLADAHSGIERFFPSEYGTDIEYGPNSVNEPPHQLKIKVRAAIREAKNLDHTFVVTGPYGDADPGLFLSAAAEGKDEGGTFDVKRKKAVLLGDGDGKVSLTTMRDVGTFVVAALKNPEASRNKALKVNSFTTTPRQLVEQFERQTGDKWEVGYTSLDRLKALEKEYLAKGDPRMGGFTLRRIWTEGGTLYKGRDNGTIGVEDGEIDNLESCVKQAVEVQTKATL